MSKQKYWFKRKCIGWGWYPSSWQGLSLTLLAILSIILNAIRIDYNSHSASDTLIGIFIPTVLTILILLIICYRTGESPRWQWLGKPLKKK